MTEDEWLVQVVSRIKQNEGVRLWRYFDTVGVPTIGYGYNLNNPGARETITSLGADFNRVYDGKNAITMKQADALLCQILPGYIAYARQKFPDFDSYPDMVRFVIVDLCFNLGEQFPDDFPKTKLLLERQDWPNAGIELEQSLWFSQVGDRGVRDVQMLKFLAWEPPLQPLPPVRTL